MMGRPGIPEEKGLIPRCLEQIFQTKESLQSQGWKYKMQVKGLPHPPLEFLEPVLSFTRLRNYCKSISRSQCWRFTMKQSVTYCLQTDRMVTLHGQKMVVLRSSMRSSMMQMGTPMSQISRSWMSAARERSRIFSITLLVAGDCFRTFTS